MSLSCRRILAGIVVTVSALASTANAQNSSQQGTPAESKTGQAGVSTYAADKIETVNLANGNMSINVPLATIAGRGSAGYTLSLSYNSKLWSANHEKEETGSDPGGIPNPYVHHYSAFYDNAGLTRPNAFSFGGGWAVSLGPAVSSRLVKIEPHECTSGHGTCFRYLLTKLNLVLPDGSEIELRDALTDGAPYYIGSSATATDRDRGRIWKSSDSSAVTYVTDATNGVVTGQYAGWVFLPNGTRLRMESFLFGMGARCTKIVDRNGNFVTIDYDNPQGVTYTDTLGRQVVFESDAATGTASIRIKGYLGVPDRIVGVNWGVIGALTSGVADNLREDFRSLPRPFTSGDYRRTSQGDFSHTILTPHTDLFDGSEGEENIDERYAVTRVNLLDGRSLRFRYNQYGEVSEVIYPGGGVSRIDYEGFPTSMCDGVSPFKETLDRRVVQRRLLTDGANVDATWRYGQGTGVVGGTSYKTGTVESRRGEGAGGVLLLSETHYFLALKAEFKICRASQSSLDFSSDGTHYEKWQNAKEFRVEKLTGTGTQVTVREWKQRSPVVWGNDPGLGYNTYVTSEGQEDITNDTRVAWEETTLENGKVKRIEFGYDDFNNVTSTKEYDFGTAGSPGTLLRQTFRTYGANIGGNYGISNNGYCYSNLNPADSSCGGGLAGDITSIIYQRHLLVNETVKDGQGNQKAYSEFEYDNYTSASNHAAIVSNSGMIQYDGARFSLFSSANQPRANVTKVTRWAGGSNNISAFSQYDNAGQVILRKDPHGNVATVSYTDNFGNGTNPEPEAGMLGPAGPTFAMASLATNALGHQAKVQFDYSLGAATGIKDANGVIAKTEYDNLGRPFRATAALGLAEQSISEMTYPTETTNEARVSKQLDATRWLSSKTWFDGFDRPVLAGTAEDGLHYNSASYTIFAKTVHDPLGRAKLVTNPYRAAAAVTDGWSRSNEDLAGRLTEVASFAGGVASPPPDSGPNADWGGSVTSVYASEVTTVTDQAGKKRRSVTDGLGRLVRVDEPDQNNNLDVSGVPFQSTSYTYDALDNLITVTQGTQTPRSFGYDSLKRLTAATNPESGTINYTYDDNGNLLTKTDALGVVATYAYDALNRNTSVVYTNDPAGTPSITRTYDGATNGKGRLWKTETAFGSRTTINSYDALGKPTSQSQQFYASSTWSQPFTVSATYGLSGQVLTLTYPSGHTVNYAYDSAGRTSSFTGNLGEGFLRTYANEFEYTASGALQQEKFGTDTPLYHKQRYNQRGQLWDMRLSTLPLATFPADGDRGAIVNYYSNNFVQGGSNEYNNGNVLRQEIYVPGSDLFQDNFSYDSLNRLTSISEQLNGTGAETFRQSYIYDRYGNRTIKTGVTETFGGVNNQGFELYTAKNRLYAPGDLAISDEEQRRMQYDAAGNLKRDTYTGAGDRIYDAENRLTKAWGGGNQWQEYSYNGDGQRARRKINGVETWQAYGLGGELLAEYQAGAAPILPQTEYGYRGGQLLTVISSGDTQRLSRFVTNLYYGALRRDPTATELQDSVTQLAAAGAGGQSALLTTAGQIGRSLFIATNYETSAPARSDVQFVGDLYYAFLQRGPDTGGLNWWVTQLQLPNNSRANVCNDFSVSPEFQALVATLYGTAASDNERTDHFVNNFYLGAYGRDATATELQQQRDALNAAAAQGQTQVQAQAEVMGRALFAGQINERLSDMQFVTNLYEGFLQRGPDAGGLTYWTQASAGQGRQNVLNNFATCGPFRELAGTLYREANWLVADHLGTPRLVVNKSGSLAGVKRHDYLPFGEELFATQGGRTITMGYTGDNVRQKFTQYERDSETDLDYAQARYYSSTMGRFTTVDPILTSARRTSPQTWNRYVYALNSPLRFVDPNGLQDQDRERRIETSTPTIGNEINPRPLTSLIPTPEESAAIQLANTSMGLLTDTMRNNVNQAIPDALGMVGAPTRPGEINPCRDALIANFGNFDPTTALQELRTTGGAAQMGPLGIEEGPQNIFNGNTTTMPGDSGGQQVIISQFLANNPTVNAVTSGRSIWLDDSFNDRDRLGRAQDIIHEAIAHRSNSRSDSEFAPAGSRQPRTDGSRAINDIIRANCNRLRN